MALLKAETADKLSDLRDEQIQRAANLKGEAAVKITTLKAETAMPVSYTHLDVYKRQFVYCSGVSKSVTVAL